MNAYAHLPPPFPVCPPFPTRHPPHPPLTLPRRNRVSLPLPVELDPRCSAEDGAEADRLLRHREQMLAERERALAEAEIQHADRARDLAELEALLNAREGLLDSSRHEARPHTPAEVEALQHLRAELDRQEASLREARETIRAREKFLEESEARLFDKAQEQQEKETALEQREEDFATRSTSSGAAGPARPYDEFRE